jgi:hypothetical protein
MCAELWITVQTLSHLALPCQVTQHRQVPPAHAYRVELRGWLWGESSGRWERALTLNPGTEQPGSSRATLVWPQGQECFPAGLGIGRVPVVEVNPCEVLSSPLLQATSTLGMGLFTGRK